VRIFATSDLHVDYAVNARWVEDLSTFDYRDDVLILAGDVSDILPRLEHTLTTLARRFRHLFFVPGNHDVWVVRDAPRKSSLQKLREVRDVIDQSGATADAALVDDVAIVPLFSWYDYSFGLPSDELRSIWMDYTACRWPAGFEAREVAAVFDSINTGVQVPAGASRVITFSHFLPRLDVMPAQIPLSKRVIYPVLGSRTLDNKVRELGSHLHVYGHSHVNRRVRIEGVTYVNNAFGYPKETRIAAKRLLCIHSDDDLPSRREFGNFSEPMKT
jgi:predicted phosphodiesterase